MAGKKSVNQAFITDPKKTQYEGFVADVVELVDTIKDLNLDNKISAVMNQLVEMKDQIQVPEGGEENQVGNKASMQKNALTKLITQLEGIRQYVRNVVQRTTGERTPLSILVNWKTDDPKSEYYRETEDEYDHNISSVMEIVKNGMALFCDGNANGFPQNIKSNLDAFNILDEYKEFTTENSVMSKVDDILSTTSKIYTKSMRITSLGKRHKAEKNLEVSLDYEKKNLEEYGKACMEAQDFSLQGIEQKFGEALLKKDDDKQATDTAKTEMDKAFAKLEKLKAKRQKLMLDGPAEEEKKRKAEADFIVLSEMVNKVRAVKKTLDEVTFKKPVPDLKGLDEAGKATYVTYKELLDASKGNMDQLAMGENEAKKRLQSVNDDITYAMKHGIDKRLPDFVSAEANRYKYLNYPTFGMEIRARLKELPGDMSIDCDRFNLNQIDAEIERKISEKKGNDVLWFSIKGMIEHAKKYCPNEFLTLPLSEKNLNTCQERANEVSDELDKDELHQKIRAYDKFKQDATVIEKELQVMDSHDQKDKAFWTKANKTLYKQKTQELDKIKNDIVELKKDKIYVEGSSSILPMIQESVGLTQCMFNYSVHQVDLYMDVVKKAKENKDAHDNGIYAARQEIYTKLVDIYESIPDNAIRNPGDKNSTKKDSGMKEPLDKMRTAKSNQEFKNAYDKFMFYYNDIKDSYTNKNMALAEKKLQEVEKIMKDTRYEERMAEYNRDIETAEADYGTKKANYEAKKAVSEQSQRAYELAFENKVRGGKYYDRKVAAESFDRNNEELAGAKYDIDRKGDRFFRMLRQPFNQFYARKDFAKKKRHGDSDEYKFMIQRLTNVVNLSEDAGLEDYKATISELKSFAQNYVTVREGQFFISKTNPMRKYRLKFAKDLIALCDDQLNTIAGSERTPQINTEVDKYLQRVDVIAVQELSEEEKLNVKNAYYQSLDARKNEAIAAYKNSAEYKAIMAHEEFELQNGLAKVQNDLNNIQQSLERLKTSNIVATNLINTTQQNLEDKKKEQEQLMKNYQIKKLQTLIEDGNLSEQEKENLQTFLNDLIANNVDLEGKKMGLKKRSSKKQEINIIEEEEDEKEKKPNRRKSMQELREEEEHRAKLDQVKKNNSRSKKKKTGRNSISSEDSNLENSAQDLSKSFISVKSMDSVEMENNDATNPKHLINLKNSSMLNEE